VAASELAEVTLGRRRVGLASVSLIEAVPRGSAISLNAKRSTETSKCCTRHERRRDALSSRT
jgi:hypothetical protein